MMPMSRMDMPVSQFLARGVAHADYLYVEVQGLARQGMVGIKFNACIGDIYHGKADLSVIAIGVYLHARNQLHVVAETRARLDKAGLGIVRPITFRRAYRNSVMETSFSTFQCFFEAGDDIVMAVQIDKWFAIDIAVEYLACVVGERIAHGNYLAGACFHLRIPYGLGAK